MKVRIYDNLLRAILVTSISFHNTEVVFVMLNHFIDSKAADQPPLSHCIAFLSKSNFKILDSICD